MLSVLGSALCLSKHPNDRRCGQEPVHYLSVVPGPGALAAGLLAIQIPGLFPRAATWGRPYLLSSPWGCRPRAGWGIPGHRGRSEGCEMCHPKVCVPLWHIDHFTFKVLTLLCPLKAAGGSPTGRVPPPPHSRRREGILITRERLQSREGWRNLNQVPSYLPSVLLPSQTPFLVLSILHTFTIIKAKSCLHWPFL